MNKLQANIARVFRCNILNQVFLSSLCSWSFQTTFFENESCFFPYRLLSHQSWIILWLPCCCSMHWYSGCWSYLLDFISGGAKSITNFDVIWFEILGNKKICSYFFSFITILRPLMYHTSIFLIFKIGFPTHNEIWAYKNISSNAVIWQSIVDRLLQAFLFFWITIYIIRGLIRFTPSYM